MPRDDFDELQQSLARFNLTFADYVILQLIHYEARSAALAPRFALALLKHTAWPLPSVEECFETIESLRRRRLVTIVDRVEQLCIGRFIGRLRCIGPLGGVPYLGQLDFTLAGAEVWRAFLNENDHGFGRDYYWNSCIYVVRRRSATIIYSFHLDMIYESMELSDYSPLSPPEPIRTWRVEWWREIYSGFRLHCRPDIT